MKFDNEQEHKSIFWHDWEGEEIRMQIVIEL